MKKLGWVVPVFFLMIGCSTQQLEIDHSKTFAFLDRALVPEELAFPDIFFPEGFEIAQHGYIPGTQMVGADLKTKQGLADVLKIYQRILEANDWRVDQLDETGLSFLLKASHEQESVELRVVRGAGVTKVYLIYRAV